MNLFPVGGFDPYGMPLDRDDPRRGIPGSVQATNLVVILFILVNAVLAGVAAIIGGPVLFALAKMANWDTRLRLGKAWQTSFIAYFGSFAVYSLQSMGRPSGFGPPVTDNFFAPEMFAYALSVQGLPMLACAAIIVWRLREDFRGVFGFVRALLFSGISLGFSGLMLAMIAYRMMNFDESAEGFVEGMLGVSLVAIVFTLLGSVTAFVVVSLSAKLGPRPEKPHGFWKIYGTAVLVLLAWFVVAGLFEFIFMSAEAIWEWYLGYRDANDPGAYLETNGVELRTWIIAASIVHVMPLLIVGSILSTKLSPVFSGRAGWFRAVFTSFAAVVAAWIPVGMLIYWLYLIGEFDDMAMYWNL